MGRGGGKNETWSLSIGTGKTKRGRATAGARPEWNLRAKRIAGVARSKRKYGQAKKGPWWMPRSYCTMKAVVSCEKPGGGAHIPRSPDSRMG